MGTSKVNSPNNGSVSPFCPQPLRISKKVMLNPSNDTPPNEREQWNLESRFFELIVWFISSYPGRYVYRVTWRFWKTDYQGKNSQCRWTRLRNTSQTARLHELFPPTWQRIFIAPVPQIPLANIAHSLHIQNGDMFIYHWHECRRNITRSTLTTLLQSIRILWRMINKIF